MSSQNTHITLSKSFKRNQCKKALHAIKKAKIEKPNNSTIGGGGSTFNSSVNQIEERTNIFYDPLKDSYYDGKKTLAPQSTQPIPITTEVPAKFMDLLESEIFNHTSLMNSLIKKLLWKEFALWSCFAIGPKFVQQFRHHCSHLWSQVNNIYRCVKAQDNPLEGHNIQKTFLRHPNDKLYIAKETTKRVASGINLKSYRHIFNPQCFTNTFGETVVDFFDIDKISARETEVVVDNYCKHMFDNPSHQSNQFKSDLIEHFGCFTDSNNMPYTTTNTASSHNKAYQKCVWSLIEGLQPLSGVVNEYLKTNYPSLYSKMKNLDLGPNFGSLFADYALDWDGNNEDVGSSQKYTSPKL
ncbi:40615_t:CDS:2, partial [Gigaspora margarita]